MQVYGDDWRRQLAQVTRELGLRQTPQFTRCLACNTPLETRSREEAGPHVPAYVHRTQPSFLGCPSCGRYYWHGTHATRMEKILGEALQPALDQLDSGRSSV